MRVCHKCGHVDPPQWKHSKYSYWIDNCLLEDFNEMQPEMVKGLLQGAILEDTYYLYRLTKNKHRVERKAKVDYGNQWTIPMERATPKHNVRDFRPNWYKVTPNQTKLSEANK
jgi:hypothetical protein